MGTFCANTDTVSDRTFGFRRGCLVCTNPAHRDPYFLAADYLDEDRCSGCAGWLVALAYTVAWAITSTCRLSSAKPDGHNRNHGELCASPRPGFRRKTKKLSTLQAWSGAVRQRFGCESEKRKDEQSQKASRDHLLLTSVISAGTALLFRRRSTIKRCATSLGTARS
jgi:hypothetical protein